MELVHCAGGDCGETRGGRGNSVLSEEKRMSKEVLGRGPGFWGLHQATRKEIQQQWRYLKKQRKERERNDDCTRLLVLLYPSTSPKPCRGLSTSPQPCCNPSTSPQPCRGPSTSPNPVVISPQPCRDPKASCI